MKTLLYALLVGEGGRLLQTTLQVGPLVVAILVAKALVGRCLPARWHAALWLLVVLRGMTPWYYVLKMED
jgi:beta-lactamase regulating signal transducer with metallopeptidase domain